MAQNPLADQCRRQDTNSGQSNSRSHGFFHSTWLFSLICEEVQRRKLLRACFHELFYTHPEARLTHSPLQAPRFSQKDLIPPPNHQSAKAFRFGDTEHM